MTQKSEFDKALHNFTMDMACGDAIRALTDRGYDPQQIKDTLTFPAPMAHITKVMWDRLVATRKILMSDPSAVPEGSDLSDGAGGISSSDYEIIERRDDSGRRSFLRVKKESSEEIRIFPEDYILFDPADNDLREKYQDNGFIRALPWPDKPVWLHRSLLERS